MQQSPIRETGPYCAPKEIDLKQRRELWQDTGQYPWRGASLTDQACKPG